MMKRVFERLREMIHKAGTGQIARGEVILYVVLFVAAMVAVVVLLNLIMDELVTLGLLVALGVILFHAYRQDGKNRQRQQLHNDATQVYELVFETLRRTSGITAYVLAPCDVAEIIAGEPYLNEQQQLHIPCRVEKNVSASIPERSNFYLLRNLQRQSAIIARNMCMSNPIRIVSVVERPFEYLIDVVRL